MPNAYFGRAAILIAALAFAALAITVPASVYAVGPPSAAKSAFGEAASAEQGVIAPPFCVSPKNIWVTGSCKCRFEGILRDAQGVPIANFPASQVVLDFVACNNPSTRPLNRIPADENSNANGLVYWEVGLNFGGGDPCQVVVRVQGDVFATVPGHQGLPPNAIDGGLRSFDENGDGLVALGDLSTCQQEFVNGGQRLDYRGDLAMPCDGVTALSDLSCFQVHFTAPGR
jgi:hypothetical protein